MSGRVPNIFTLQQEREIRNRSKNDVYSIVLNRCIEKITYTNRNTDKSFVIFEVPKILIGYPYYDMQSCIMFLMNKLSEQQYLVEFIDPFYLYIDWGTAIQKNSKQAQIPSMNPDRLKRQTKRLLQRFPETKQVEFIYEDAMKTKKK